MSRAVGIAPSKGAAFDKAHGIVIEVMPSDKQVSIRATDLDTYITTWIPAVECEGEDVQWRLSANAFGGMVSKLKNGRQVTLKPEKTKEGGVELIVTSGMMRAGFQLLDMASYPEWDIFDSDDLTDVSGLAAALNNVSWAAAGPSEAQLNSVHFTGEHVVATDRYKFARYPLKVAEGGITLPLSAIKFLSTLKGDVKFGFDGFNALVMPDDDTQIKVIALGTEYPVAVLDKLAEVEYTDKVQVNADEFADMIDLTSAINTNDRVSKKLTFWIGRQQIAAMVASETDRARDIMSVPGQATHDHRVEIRINPKYLSDALTNGEGLCTIHDSSA
ncbi:DNA polymerase III subunit beta, partial [Streptomyces solisilvae]|uniref:DNA polymerase III subunit beta n=1 Tax=Streptomyces malaysiensis TaxID=92644 RepID=UPI0036B47D8B